MKANDLSAISIGDEKEIGKAVFYRNVSNVSYPEFMGVQRRKSLYQIGVAVKEVFGVGGGNVSFSVTNQQLIFGQQMKERISSNAYFLFQKKWL